MLFKNIINIINGQPAVTGLNTQNKELFPLLKTIIAQEASKGIWRKMVKSLGVSLPPTPK